MRSFTSLFVFALSFVALVVSTPLQSNTHSSRFAKNPISSRQFRYPRALADVCANVDVSLILDGALKLGSSGNICLCLSALPLNLDSNTNLQLLANLIGAGNVQAKLEALVKNKGTQCTYPDHASPQCTSGNVCAFTCTDGFAKQGDTCVCPLSNSVCNGRCGSYLNGCSSALPRAPKMARRSITSSHNGGSSHSHSRGLSLGANINLNIGGLVNGLLGSTGTEIDTNSLVSGLVNSLGITVPISGVNLSSGLEAEVDICVGTGISNTQSLLDTITNVVNSLLSLLLGTTVESNVKLLCSSSANTNTTSIDLQVCGLSDGSTLNETLDPVTDLLNSLLNTTNIVINSSVGGPGCPTSLLPVPSPTSVEIPNTSVSASLPASINLSALLDQVSGILGSLGLTLGAFPVNTTTDLIVGVSVGLSNTLDSTSELVATVLALVNETLNFLTAINITVQSGPDPNPLPTSSNPVQGAGIVVDIDLGAVVGAVLSDPVGFVEVVSSAVSNVLTTSLGVSVAVNVDSGLI